MQSFESQRRCIMGDVQMANCLTGKFYLYLVPRAFKKRERA